MYREYVRVYVSTFQDVYRIHMHSTVGRPHRAAWQLTRSSSLFAGAFFYQNKKLKKYNNNDNNNGCFGEDVVCAWKLYIPTCMHRSTTCDPHPASCSLACGGEQHSANHQPSGRSHSSFMIVMFMFLFFFNKISCFVRYE